MTSTIKSHLTNSIVSNIGQDTVYILDDWWLLVDSLLFQEKKVNNQRLFSPLKALSKTKKLNGSSIVWSNNKLEFISKIV